MLSRWMLLLTIVSNLFDILAATPTAGSPSVYIEVLSTDGGSPAYLMLQITNPGSIFYTNTLSLATLFTIDSNTGYVNVPSVSTGDATTYTSGWAIPAGASTESGPVGKRITVSGVAEALVDSANPFTAYNPMTCAITDTTSGAMSCSDRSSDGALYDGWYFCDGTLYNYDPDVSESGADQCDETDSFDVASFLAVFPGLSPAALSPSSSSASSLTSLFISSSTSLSPSPSSIAASPSASIESITSSGLSASTSLPSLPSLPTLPSLPSLPVNPPQSTSTQSTSTPAQQAASNNSSTTSIPQPTSPTSSPSGNNPTSLTSTTSDNTSPTSPNSASTPTPTPNDNNPPPPSKPATITPSTSPNTASMVFPTQPPNGSCSITIVYYLRTSITMVPSSPSPTTTPPPTDGAGMGGIGGASTTSNPFGCNPVTSKVILGSFDSS